MNDYEGFIEDIEDLCEKLWSLAKEKLEIEAEAMNIQAAPGMASPGHLLVVGAYALWNKDTLGNESACDYEGTKKKVLSFAGKYCFSCGGIEGSVEDLEKAEEKFEIGEELRIVTEDLNESWPTDTNESAGLFREHYIDPIADIKGDQKALIKLAKEDLEGIPKMVDQNRKALKGALTTTIEKLAEFNPAVHLGLDILHYDLLVWSLAAPDPVSGRAASIADLILTGSEEKTYLLGAEVGFVADFFTALRSAVDAAAKEAKGVIEGIRDTVDATLAEIEEDDEKYVLKGPSQ